MISTTAEKGVQTDEPRQEQFRMEKSVLTKSNFDELSMISGDKIPETLLQYICYEHQWNLFGYGVLDPLEFAKSFKFSLNYLLRTHEDPYQLQIRKILKNGEGRANHRKQRNSRTEQDEIMCLNRVENALYILANYSLNVRSTSVIDDKLLIRQYGFLRIIESFAMIQDLKTGKILYAYKLNENFRRNLLSLYLTTRRDSFVALRKSGLGVLYSFLLRLRDALYTKGVSSSDINSGPDFEYLCSLAAVPPYKEARYRKRDLNQSLNKIRKNTELEFDVEWVKGTGEERYVPIFHFIPSLDLQNKRAADVRKYGERLNVAVQEFKHNLADICPYTGNLYDSKAEEFFYKWLTTDDPEQLRAITFSLEKSFVNLGCGIPSDIPERISYFRYLVDKEGGKNIDEWLHAVFSDNSRGFRLPSFHCEEK